MCRNIKTLFNLDPPASEDEVRDAALQFVRKISGYNRPSPVNQEAFEAAVDDIARTALQLLGALQTNSAPKDREELMEKARARMARRIGG